MRQKYEEYTENPGIYGLDMPERNPALTKSGSFHLFGLDRWSKPDENHRVKYIGMADARETFDRLRAHLEAHGLLPDEYSSYSDELSGGLSEFKKALCIPSFGSSEGIYPDISLACRNSDGKQCFQSFAIGKTLGETADDYFRMFRVATECPLILNGREFSYERNNVDIMLTGKEVTAVANSMELDLCGYLEPEAGALLSSALDEFTGVSCMVTRTITCRGCGDYAVWDIGIPSDMFHSIVHETAEEVGTLEKLISGMDLSSGCETRFLTQMKGGRFAFSATPERMNGLRDYETQGNSVYGSREQTTVGILTDWEPIEEPEDKMER